MKIEEPRTVVFMTGGTASRAATEHATLELPEDTIIFVQPLTDDGSHTGELVRLEKRTEKLGPLPPMGDIGNTLSASMHPNEFPELKSVMRFRFAEEHCMPSGRPLTEITLRELLEYAFACATHDPSHVKILEGRIQLIADTKFAAVRDLLDMNLDAAHLIGTRTTLKGMTLRNMLLAALVRRCEDFAMAIEALRCILGVRDTVRVLPVSLQRTTLIARLRNGEVIRGESSIEAQSGPDDRAIADVWLEPRPLIHPQVHVAIKSADAVFALGTSLVTSLMPILQTDGVKEDLKKVFFGQVIPLTRSPSETPGYRSGDFIDTVSKLIGRPVDLALVNDPERLSCPGCDTWSRAWFEALGADVHPEAFPVLISPPQPWPKHQIHTEIVIGSFAEIYHPDPGKSAVRHNAQTFRVLMEAVREHRRSIRRRVVV